MLLNLHVKNIALIDDVEIDFTEGLNILTGETGAGKSILIDAVNFALGARMPKDVVRDDSKNALCELVFSVDDAKTVERLRELDVEPDDGNVILQRKLSAGKSSLKCNDQAITTSAAKDIASLLIDIHGQHEHQSLLYKNNHRIILDGFCGNDFNAVYAEYSEIYKQYKDAKREYEDAVLDNANRDADADYCAFVVDEISNAKLKIGEDDELEERYRRMNNSRRIAEAMQAVREYLAGDASGASSNVSRAVGVLRGASSLDEGIEGLYEQLTEVEGLLQDFERSLTDYEDELTFSPEDFATVEGRLNEINRLKQKYAPTIEGILKRMDDEQEKLDRLADYDSYLADLKGKFDGLHNNVVAGCKTLSSMRAKKAEVLATDIRQALIDLNFLDARFEISIVCDEEKITENGWDDIEFMISTNPGEKVKPLTQVASGGELSRIMLALKAVLAQQDSIGTLIFDEIDTGISGKTAQLVADKMSYIAKSHQVICVTHLPQIASHADTHFEISKAAVDNHTSTSVRCLNYDESVAELARMLGGASITEAVLANAKEMKSAKAN